MAKHKRYVHRKRNKPGTAPGTIVVSATPSAPLPSMQVMAYDATQCVEARLTSIAQVKEFYNKWPVIWVNIDGIDNAAMVQEMGEIFQLHPLALEDTVNAHQRPKTEDYGTHIYTVCHMANDAGGEELDLEQISIFIGKGFVLSFQEAPGDCWDIIRDRIRRSTGSRLREMGSDYLAYILIDAVIDGYFPLLEKFGDRIDDLEERVMNKPQNDVMIGIHSAKRYTHTVRHSIWPMRESINQIMAHETLVQPNTRIFLRDCQDHVVQLLDIVETYRERLSGLMDMYLSSLTVRMNEVMKVLAVITTIFMPLTFIAGVYGMNFNPDTSPYNMPELNARYGYIVCLAVMGLLAVGMIIYFIRLGWLKRSDP